MVQGIPTIRVVWNGNREIKKWKDSHIYLGCKRKPLRTSGENGQLSPLQIRWLHLKVNECIMM